MDGTTDDLYFEWLYGLVGAVRNRNPKRSYWGLLNQMHRKEFIWLVPNDDNRIEDGKELRYEFIDAVGIDEPPREWLELGCSMLEMLVGLSRRASFETDMEPAEWFWIMLDNAGLRAFNDEYRDKSKGDARIDEILDALIFRNYNSDGGGGLFPLKNPRQNQTDVELWYQLSAYLNERLP